jgi:hypothetical protein
MLVLATEEVTEIREMGSPELLAIVITIAEFPWILAAVTVTWDMTTSLVRAEAPQVEVNRMSVIREHDARRPIAARDFLTIRIVPAVSPIEQVPSTRPSKNPSR